VVPLLMVSVAAVVGGLLMPYMSSAWEKGDRELACRQNNWTIKFMAIGFTIGGIFVLLLAPLLFQGVFQGRYDDGLAVLPMTLVYCIWFSLFTVGQNYLWVAERGKWAALAMMVGLGVNLTLNMLLIPSYGLNGAVFATTAGNAVNLIILYVYTSRYGCKTDRSIWLVTTVPLALLLPLPVATVVMLLVAGVAIGTEWLLSNQEKAEIKAMVLSRLS
jgi:O-antigen/teichoic acid export membrane protein